ncbi:MAG: CerR family C-terminal domain-containing protein [Gammaproteobacteria bacterium]|nr:CerR family C-terminal domain-containing protein [Gammaproteobacteria bacterium]
MNAVQSDLEYDTRRRLIEAASDIFIEQGYQATKIRDIVKHAKANLAAINYHFGGKEGLYNAVIQSTATLVFQEQSQSVAAHSTLTPEDQLKEYVRIFLKRLLDDTVQARWGKLIARETVEPTAAFDMIIEKFIMPAHGDLKNIVHAVLGQDVDEENVKRGAMSVIGQCLYYQIARRVIGHLDPDFHFTPATIDRLAEHITAFSLGGLRELAQKQNAL